MKSYQGKNVIITGGTGAIGSKVVKKLLKAGKIIFL
jgi:FlaA1/EpsC-like NDP-sugar epimerase